MSLPPGSCCIDFRVTPLEVRVTPSEVCWQFLTFTISLVILLSGYVFAFVFKAPFPGGPTSQGGGDSGPHPSRHPTMMQSAA